MYEENDVGNIKEMVEIAHEQYSKDPSGFEKLLNDAEKPLYEGCKKFTKLSTLVKLYNLKVRHGWSNISFSELLKALKDVVYHLDSLRTSSRDDIKYVTNMALTIFQSQKNLKKTRKTTFWKVVKCPLQIGTVECGYYVMRYMREILSKDTSIITDAIDTRNSYSQLELDEVRVEWAEFLSRYI
ncbi:uncharacterized protein E6C27_scaffold55G00040 [Cucumis melo var. makuwa]|uniref:Ubiquitin-like protease family profile domain-containing protein n=1 Tax=Cucumis melo var. makuwa TaxID=1194695 RepID=A0A5A7UA50_CUCMM|nr:uncharacterized protein E6C27_scaffold55G00040 [Cucumis melo var. makuwa]